MILTFDVGNTETTVGLFAQADLRAHWRLTTEVARTTDEIVLLVAGLLAHARVERHRLTGAVVGSVVPVLTGPLAEACESLTGRPTLLVDASSRLPIRLDVDEPLTVGADRVINTLAASRRYRRDAIVVDLGTATTYDCITADGVFLGGIIAPGVRSSADTLVRRTSKLPATELVPPVHVIGRRTEECIRAGVLLGAADAIDGLVRRLRRAWPRPDAPLVVATGGLASTMAPLCTEIDVVEPFLTLDGLRIAFELLSATDPQASGGAAETLASLPP